MDAIAKTNKFLRIDNSEVDKFYIQVNLLDAYYRGSGLGLVDNYRKAGVITTGPSEDVNIRIIVHEYLHGVINPIADSIGRNDDIESIIRAIVIHIVDKPEIQLYMVKNEMNSGFTQTKYVYEQMKQFENYEGSLEDFLNKILNKR